MYKVDTKINTHKFESDWAEAVYYVESTLQKMEGLRDGFGIVNPNMVPYNPTIPVIAALLCKIGQLKNPADANSKLYRWYWSTVFSGAYEASGNSRITSDYKEMQTWFIEEKNSPTAIKEMTHKINSLDLEKTTSSFGAVYKGILSLIALSGGTDLAKNLRIENSEDLDKDYIFPRSHYKNEKYVDSVLNISWMSSETNQKIKKVKKPSIFFPQILQEIYDGNKGKFCEVLQSHLINVAAHKALLEDNFDLFIKSRKEEIIQKIKQFAGMQTVLEKDLKDNPNQALNIFEKKMRNLIDRMLFEKYSHGYWKQYVPGTVKANIEERIGKETSKNPSIKKDFSAREKLDYVDISEYFLILRYNWDIFEDIFKNREITSMHMNHICDYRNPEKHAREKYSVVQKLGEAGLEWVIGCIDKN